MKLYEVLISIYMALIRGLGITPHILDFDAIKRNPMRSSTFETTKMKKQRRLWRYLAITICIAFACGYPYSMMKLLQNSSNDKKGVDLFITYIYYGAKYFVTLIIYTVQFRNNKQFHRTQMMCLTMYRKLWLVMAERRERGCPGHRLAVFRFERRKCVSMSGANVCNLAKTVAMVAGYYWISNLKLVHIFNGPVNMNTFELACYYYPNIFICVFVTQFYVGILQQVHVFQALNTIFHDFGDEMNFLGLKRDGWERSNADSVVLKNADKRPYHTIRDELDEMIEMHDDLRYINTCLEQLSSIQVIFIIVNTFMNIVSEVSIFSSTK